MSLVRYDPATEVNHSGQIGGTGAGSCSAAMAAGTDYAGAADANWFQSGAYTPNGSAMVVYHGATIAPHASAIPAGKDIVGLEVAFLAGSYGSFGAINAAVNFVNNQENVFASRTYSDTTPAWAHTVRSDFFVPAASVAAFLASGYFDIYQTVPLGAGAAVRLDYFSAYVMFTVGIGAALTFPVGLTLDASASQIVTAAVTF